MNICKSLQKFPHKWILVYSRPPLDWDISFLCWFIQESTSKLDLKPRTPRLLTYEKTMTEPIRTVPSIPSVHDRYGTRSPRINQPYSAEHEKSAQRQDQPLEYLKKGGLVSQPQHSSACYRKLEYTYGLRPLLLLVLFEEEWEGFGSFLLLSKVLSK